MFICDVGDPGGNTFWSRLGRKKKGTWLFSEYKTSLNKALHAYEI
jgi:hypothetical protein